jgi:hypothetical protein
MVAEDRILDFEVPLIDWGMVPIQQASAGSVSSNSTLALLDKVTGGGKAAASKKKDKKSGVDMKAVVECPRLLAMSMLSKSAQDWTATQSAVAAAITVAENAINANVDSIDSITNSSSKESSSSSSSSSSRKSAAVQLMEDRHKLLCLIRDGTDTEKDIATIANAVNADPYYSTVTQLTAFPLKPFASSGS